uniref:BZIP domain-containing protein n=1 Tax=Ditylenchus dipsaci TaxID=166011 RepID=A0A915CTG8_9BILA
MPMCGWVLPCAHFSDCPQGTMEDVEKARKREQNRAASARYLEKKRAEGGARLEDHKRRNRVNQATFQRKKQAEKIIKSLQREERVKAFEERIQRGEPGTSHLSPDTSEVESIDEDDQEK